MKKIQIELDISDIQRLMEIALDDKANDALEFIKQKLVKHTEKKLQRH